MADPTIQTFCCHHSNRTDMAIVVMQEFNTDVYNTVCLLSSSIGILGAVYQVSKILIKYNKTLTKLICRYFQEKHLISLTGGKVFLHLEEERSLYGLQLQISQHHWVIIFVFNTNMNKMNRRNKSFYFLHNLDHFQVYLLDQHYGSILNL